MAPLLALAWLACAPAPDQRARASERVLATLTRQACFLGVCPDYSLTIYEDGTVRYQGNAHVSVVGTRTKTLPPQKLAEIAAAFEAVRYLSLKDRYEGGPTDLAWVYTSYTKDGRTKKVAHYTSGDSGAPPALDVLEGRIDEVVGTHEWVGTREEAWKRRDAEARAADAAARARLPVLRKLLRESQGASQRKAAYELLVLTWLIGPADRQAAAPIVAEALADPDPKARAEAARHLIQFGPEGAALVTALTKALSDPNPKIREEAAGALFRIGPAAALAIPALEAALRDPEPLVRGEAERALATLRASSVSRLAADLGHKDELTRQFAVATLVEMGSEARAAFPALARALKDVSPRIRGQAAEALGKIGPPARAAAPALREALLDAEPSVREAARTALARIEAVR